MAEVEIDHSLVWPDKPTAHGRDAHAARFGEGEYRPPRAVRDDADPYEECYRTCSYCGSIAPEDLYSLLKGKPVVEVEPHDPAGGYEAMVERVKRQEASGIRVGGSDWKYGWPHKFYVDGIPNPAAGTEYKIYQYGGAPKHGEEWEEYTDHTGNPGRRMVYNRRPRPDTQRAKFYSIHFLDIEDETTFTVFAGVIEAHAGVRFSKNEQGELMYRAPYRGYQR